jgi:hypothetical protein
MSIPVGAFCDCARCHGSIAQHEGRRAPMCLATSNAQAFDTKEPSSTPYQRTEEDDRFADMVWSASSPDSPFADCNLEAPSADYS